MLARPLLACAIWVSAVALPTFAQMKEQTTTKKTLPALIRAATAKRGQAPRNADTALPVLTFRERVEFTISLQECSLLRAPLTATGSGKTLATPSANEDGTLHIDIATEVSGMAEDASGGKYIWSYRASAYVDTPDLEPTHGSPYTGEGPATFQLIPLGTQGGGFNSFQYFSVPTTKLLGDRLEPAGSNTPVGCNPRPAGAY